MLERQDLDLAWMLQFENIAWYEEGRVYILDRRIYPIDVRKVECKNYHELAQAIKNMVTQSAGPYMAAAMGMALAAYECRGRSEIDQLEYLSKASEEISHARPTTTWRMQKITQACLKVAGESLSMGICDVSERIREFAIDQNTRRYEGIAKVGKHLAGLFPNHGAIMTQCFAETIVGMMLREAKKQKKEIKIYCPETRPFFQGSRLTATVCHDMGFDVTVITDNMPAAVMKNEGIDLFTSAADVICCDGYVINKVGTYQIAIDAKYHGIPYYVSGAPDIGHPSVDTVRIEMRDPSEVLMAMGVPTANPSVKGYYPAFDITPPELVSGIVTDRGVFDPFKLSDYSAGPDDFLV